jgi:hypothetical protein
LFDLRSRGGTSAFLPHAIPRLKINKLSTLSKSRSSNAILSTSQGKAYLLNGL